MPSDADAAARSERSFLIDDAARLLGVSRRTVYYRIREGRLLTIRAKCGSQRVLLSSMEVLMRGRQEAGAATDPAAADVVGCAGELAGGSETKALPL
jgi:excisionase family DNA binding protein